MAYTINERALARWTQENLQVLAEEGPRTVYRFHYTGCTCVNGGQEFPAYIDLTLERERERYRITDAVISLDPAAPGVPVSCRYEDPQRRDFLARNVAESGVQGADLEEFLCTDRPVNPAGCFCSVEHVNHKLLMVLQTIRFALKPPRSPT